MNFARIAQLFRLALFDLRHEWAITLCQIASVAAVLSPLLVLYGLQQGVIGTLLERMNRDPAMRAIIPDVAGGNRFDAEWFESMRKRPEVDFVMPNTRAIAAQVDLLPKDGTATAPLRVSWLPTAPGDPVAGEGAALAEGMDRISVSPRVAEKLGLKPGDQVLASIERSRGGRVEPVALTLTVLGVVAPDRYDGLAAFVSLPLQQAVQDYRDGFAVPALGWPGEADAPPAQAYPLFRLYAKTIRDVEPLAADLRKAGVSVSTREGEIAGTLALSRNLTVILAIIAALGASGYLVSLAASLWANAQRKRRELAVLGLVGYAPGWLACFPLFQSGVIALAGSALAIVLFEVVAGAINLYFSRSIATGESACELGAAELAVCVLATVAVSLLPATITGLFYGRLEISEELRDV